MADLKTNLLGFTMNSPIIGASGTVGYGVEYEELADFSKIGGISGKGLTLHGQYGNKGERLWETPSGLINSIGLQNPGVQHFIDVELGEMLELKQKYGTVAIANLGGHSEEEYVEGAAMLSESGVDIVELNISCPNVKVGGMAYGVKAEAAGEVVRMVRDACKKPLMVKLSPQAENIPEMCKAVEAAGADAISLTNTFQACAIDLEKRRPVFDNIFAGLSGPAVRPIALRMVWQAVGAVNIPVVGLGGIATGKRCTGIHHGRCHGGAGGCSKLRQPPRHGDHRRRNGGHGWTPTASRRWTRSAAAHAERIKQRLNVYDVCKYSLILKIYE